MDLISYFKNFLKIFIIAVALLTTISSSLNANKLSITTNYWYPYVSFDAQKPGIITQIVKTTLKDMNYNLEINKNEFDKGYKDSLKNRYDATYPYFKTQKRAEQMYYSDPLLNVENVLFYNKTNFSNDINNIYKYKIGIVKGYSYKNIQIEKFKNIITIENELEAFDMLDHGKIDLLPSNKLVATHIINTYFNDFYSNIAIINDKNFISTDFLHLIMPKNKKNKQFMEKFNASLKNIKKKGEYKKILLKNRAILNPHLSHVIRLTNNTETYPMVVASSKVNSKTKYIIPRGTKAIVLEWSPHFIHEGNLKIYDEMFKKTKIQIINGPLKGKILFIENMYIEIE